jgi:hypothetical protein
MSQNTLYGESADDGSLTFITRAKNHSTATSRRTALRFPGCAWGASVRETAMPLIVCKDCKKEFSTDARRCPHCGAKKPRHKSRIGVVLLVIFLGLVAIGSVVNNKSSTTNSATGPASISKAAWEYASISVAEKTLKYALKDADSAEFRNVGVIIPAQPDTKTMGVVCGEVNAKTGLGGYSGYGLSPCIRGYRML